MQTDTIDRMKALLLRLIRARGVFGLYAVNWIFQYVLRITSRRVLFIHFTNTISADRGVFLTGVGEHAERCLRVNGGILVQASNGVEIDRSVLIAPGVKIISGNHDLNDFAKESVQCNPIVIGADCWLGANSVILPGVDLLPGTIVGAGSVVTRGFGRGHIVVAGNPAKIVRER